jgi:hypothetical protein
VLQVNWWAVPGYDIEDVARGIGPEEFEREVLISWAHRKGKSVTPWFGQKTHVALDPIPYDPGRPLHIGLDWERQPTAVFSQVNAYHQWCILSCVQVPEDETSGVYEFGVRIAEHLLDKYAAPNRVAISELPLVFIGDPSGAQPPARVGDAVPKPGSPREVRSAFDILRHGVEVYVGRDERGEPIYEKRPGWGWDIIRGEMYLLRRLEALRMRGQMLVGQGQPALVVDPECHLVIDALSGGWHYHQRNTGEYEPDPKQDWAKDVGDALSYIPHYLNVLPVSDYVSTTARRSR